jgi:hypothetical protein
MPFESNASICKELTISKLSAISHAQVVEAQRNKQQFNYAALVTKFLQNKTPKKTPTNNDVAKWR